MGTDWDTIVVKSGLVAAETYDIEWNIENFFTVQQNPELLLRQRLFIDTESGTAYQCKLAIGFFKVGIKYRSEFRLGCSLNQISGKSSSVCLRFSAKLEDVFNLAEVKTLTPGYLILLEHDMEYNVTDPLRYNTYVDSDGTMKLKIQLKVLKSVPATGYGGVQLTTSKS